MKQIIGTILLLLFIQPNLIYSQQNCLILSLPFDGNADDNSGNNLDGIVNGASLVSDRFGNSNAAYSFDGLSDFIYISNDSLFNFGVNDDFSISLWVKAPLQQINLGSPANEILIKWEDNGGGNEGYPFALRLFNSNHNQDGKIRIVRWDKNCSNLTRATSSSTLNDDKYHHLVYVKNGTTIQMYVDNTLESTFTDSSSCTTKNNNDLYIGKVGGISNSNHFKGEIDDINIYRCALTANEVNDLFYSGSDTNASCLLADYPFDSDANDVSGNNLNGVVNGAQLTSDRFGNPNSAFYFDGQDDYISVAHDPRINFNVDDDFSISLWIKAPVQQSNTSNTANEILTKWQDNGGASDGYPFAVRIYNSTHPANGKARIIRWDKTCTNLTRATTSTTLNDNDFHHLVYVKKDSIVDLYVDNMLEGSFIDTTACYTGNTDDLYFGKIGGLNMPSHFEGVLDDIKIFNCALSIDEIDSLYTPDTTGMTSVKPLESIHGLRVYPNPANHNIQIDYHSRGIVIAEIMDMIGGQVLFTKDLSSPIDVSQLGNGVYFVILKNQFGEVLDRAKFVHQSR